jgi:hypothetical protein
MIQSHPPDDNSTSEEISQYLASRPFGEEDYSSFVDSLTVDTLLELPWHVQFRVVAYLPSHDSRMMSLIPHIASKVQRLGQDERDLVILDDAWRNNVLFQDWITSRQAILKIRRGVHTTKSHMRLLWSIIHGMDEVLGEKSVDDSCEANPIYDESAKRQDDVFMRWKVVEQHRLVAKVFSLDFTSSINSICSDVGQIKCVDLQQLYDNMRPSTTSNDVDIAVKAIIEHGAMTGFARNGRARLVAFIYLKQNDILKKSYVCVLATGLFLLYVVGFNPNLCCRGISEITTRFPLAQEEQDAIREELIVCGISLQHAETLLSSLLPLPSMSSQSKVTLTPTSSKKRRIRESAAAVVDKLYGNSNSSTNNDGNKTSLLASHMNGAPSTNVVDVRKITPANLEAYCSCGNGSSDDDDGDDYDESNDCILLL